MASDTVKGKLLVTRHPLGTSYTHLPPFLSAQPMLPSFLFAFSLAPLGFFIFFTCLFVFTFLNFFFFSGLGEGADSYVAQAGMLHTTAKPRRLFPEWNSCAHF